MDRDRFDRAIATIDAANADDPNTIVVRGDARPKELAHAELDVAERPGLLPLPLVEGRQQGSPVDEVVLEGQDPEEQVAFRVSPGHDATPTIDALTIPLPILRIVGQGGDRRKRWAR